VATVTSALYDLIAGVGFAAFIFGLGLSTFLVWHKYRTVSSTGRPSSDVDGNAGSDGPKSRR
jgi:hypothetical protein